MSDAPPTGLLARLRAGLARTQARLAGGVVALLPLGRSLDSATLEELETVLLQADVGVAATAALVAAVRAGANRQVEPIVALERAMLALLDPVQAPPTPLGGPPHVVLVVGVNGVGKTTTIAKLAHFHRQAGRSVLLSAGDTFRAAATEQLQRWGERLGVAVIAQQPGADPAAVTFDALRAAQARGSQVLIADTSGRLHTQAGLMDELGKVVRVLRRADPAAPHETLLVLDAGTGQNALAQARAFHRAAPLSGLVLTKLDGTAKGGMVLALAQELRLPVRWLGVGEQLDDLRPFTARDFVAALLGREPQP